MKPTSKFMFAYYQLTLVGEWQVTKSSLLSKSILLYKPYTKLFDCEKEEWRPYPKRQIELFKNRTFKHIGASMYDIEVLQSCGFKPID